MSLSPLHDDSLDNLNINKLRQSSLEKSKTLIGQVKQKFVGELEKLQSAETRQIGICEIKKIIDQYREPDYLRIYFAVLKNLKPNTNSTTKEHQILVVSLLAQINKQNLLDPIDKPPSILKTCLRLIQIVHGYFADTSPTVQQACARALIDLTTYCLQGQNAQTIISLIIAPLLSILRTGVDKASQSTSCVCLNQIILFCRRNQNQEILQKISHQILAVILKINSEYQELFQAVTSMIDFKGISFFENRLVQFLAKILSIINGTRESSNSFNNYMCKVNVCKIIEKIGSQMEEKEKLKLCDLNILESLEKATRHRIIQVQMAASKAIKAWKGQKIQANDVASHSKGLLSLQQMRNHKKLERSKSKQDRQKMQNQLTFMKEDLEKMVKGGWGANKRAKNFVRRGSGIGGGYQGKIDTSPQNKNAKSHKEHIEQLRDYIKVGAKNNRNIERFTFVDQKKQRSRSISPSPKKTPPKLSKNISENKNSNDGQEAYLDIDEGVQQVYFPQKIAQKNTKKSQSFEMSEGQVQDLLKNQEQLLKDAEKMKINFNTSKSEKSQKSKYSKSQQKNEPQLKNINKLKQNNANQNLRINLIPNEISEENKIKIQQKQQLVKEYFKRISEQELVQLIEDYNLSQVSENLDNLLNESDLKMLQKSNISVVDSAIMKPNEGKSELQSLKDVLKDHRSQKNSKVSTLNKFLKKPENKVASQIQPIPVTNNTNNKMINSLNFTDSIASRQKSPKKQQIQTRQIQFTLNPQDRFSNIKNTINTPQQQQQIQQEIAMSYYEQSIPKLANELPIDPKQSQQRKDNIQVKNQYQIPSEAVTKNYQNLIRNPPQLKNEPSRFVEKKSIISAQSREGEGRKIESEMDQINSEDQPLSSKWIKILDLLKLEQINQAYQQTLKMDDPIYLLRLMLLTKSPVKKLTADTSGKLWSKFLQVYSHYFLDAIFVQIFSEAKDLNLIKRSLSLQQLKVLMGQLYQISGMTKGKLSFNAASLYNDIQSSLKGKQK